MSNDYRRIRYSVSTGNRHRLLPWYYKQMDEVLGDQAIVKPASVVNQHTLKPVSVVHSLSGNFLITIQLYES